MHMHVNIYIYIYICALNIAIAHLDTKTIQRFKHLPEAGVSLMVQNTGFHYYGLGWARSHEDVVTNRGSKLLGASG
jgi:hypothetical protein